MNISTEQVEDIQRLAMPLMKWLHDNCHPHCRFVVQSESVELLEAVALGKCPSIWVADDCPECRGTGVYDKGLEKGNVLPCIMCEGTGISATVEEK